MGNQGRNSEFEIRNSANRPRSGGLQSAALFVTDLRVTGYEPRGGVIPSPFLPFAVSFFWRAE
jgi:hypothetical protein